MKNFTQRVFTGLLFSVCCFNLSCSKSNSSEPATTKQQVVTVSTIAGVGMNTGTVVNGPGSTATFLAAFGIAVDAAGNMFVSDGDKLIRKITPSNVVSTYAGSLNSTGSQDGDLSSATFSLARGLAFDPSGNLLVADGPKIRKITPTGVVTSIQITTGSSAIVALTTDPAGNIYSIDNRVIYKTTPNGVTSIFAGGGGTGGDFDGTGTAASFDDPYGITIDQSGNLYVVDYIVSSVRKITPSAVVTTIAGGTKNGFANGVGKQALFANPISIVADKSGNLYVSDQANHLIRKITPDGTVSTFAGNSGYSFFYDGPALTATFPYYLCGLNIDAAGNIYAVESFRVRKLTIQ